MPRLFSFASCGGRANRKPEASRRYGYGLLALVAAALLWSAPSGAATVESTPDETAPEQQPILFEADDVVYDQQNEIVHATGHVHAVQAGRVLLADDVYYYRRQDRLVARGNVSLTDPDGNTFFGKEAELHNELKTGIINGFSALLDNGARFAANRAERIQGNRNILEKGVYSACPVCNDKGEDIKPTWQIKAVRVVQDRERLTVAYRDVIFEVKGVPVFYVPYFSHPDPSVKRKSGFLTPTVGTSDRLGTVAEIPYFFNLAPNYDLTVSPMFTGKDSIVLKSEWRHRTPFGIYDFSGSITNAKDRTDTNMLTGSRDIRGHIFGDGEFGINAHSRAGFQIQHTNKDTYLRRYEITDETDLESRLFYNRNKGRNFLWVSSHYFQGLRQTDDPGTTPFVLPRIMAHRSFTPRPGWGRINVDGDVLVLQRTEGVDSRRISLGADWQRIFTNRWGQIVRPFANVRADIHDYADRNLATPPLSGSESKFVSRVLPTAGLEWRWPFMRQGKHANIIVEPIVQFVASPMGGNPDSIINEDSQTLVFDTSSLFSADKFAGLDRFEDGQRFNVGARATAILNNGNTATATFGRQYRLQKTTAFGPETGLGGLRSDYVGSVSLQLAPGLTFTDRLRLDSQNLTLKLNEIEASANFWRINVFGNYLNVDKFNTSVDLPVREEIYMGGTFRLTKYWSAAASTRRDLRLNQPLKSGVGLIYQDDCTRFSLTFNRSFYRDRDLQPSDTLLFQLSLFGLGDIGTK